MRYRVELSTEAQKQLARFPQGVIARIESEIDQMEECDDSLWSNTKALQRTGVEGAIPQASRLVSDHLHEEISAILMKSKDTYR